MALIDIDLFTSNLFKTFVIPGIIVILWLSDLYKRAVRTSAISPDKYRTLFVARDVLTLNVDPEGFPIVFKRL